MACINLHHTNTCLEALQSGASHRIQIQLRNLTSKILSQPSPHHLRFCNFQKFIQTRKFYAYTYQGKGRGHQSLPTYSRRCPHVRPELHFYSSCARLRRKEGNIWPPSCCSWWRRWTMQLLRRTGKKWRVLRRWPWSPSPSPALALQQNCPALSTVRKEASGASPISRNLMDRAHWNVPEGYILEDAVYSGLGRSYLVERRNQV